MKLRIAKKILRDSHISLVNSKGETVKFLWSQNIIEQAWVRVRRYQSNSPTGQVTRASRRLAQFIVANPNNREAIQEQWQKLRAQILRDWYPECWDEAEYQRELVRFDDVMAERRARQASNPAFVSREYLDNPAVRLESDIAYYADRWCEMRVAFIDRTIQWMMEA